MQREELNKRLDCEGSSKGSIYIHEEGIGNEIRQGVIDRVSDRVSSRVGVRVGIRVKVSESLSESRVGLSEHQ